MNITEISVTELLLDLLHFEVGATSRWIKGNGMYDPGSAPLENDVEVLPGVLMPRQTKKARKARSAAVDANIPPSTLRDIRKLCETAGYSSALPLFSSHIPLRIKLANDVWEEAVQSTGSVVTLSRDQMRPVKIKVEFADVNHDNHMLRFGNRSMKYPELGLHPCIFKEEGTCKSLELRGTRGVLDAYCTPSQLQLFHSKGVVPPRAPCLLCCRDLVTASVVAAQNTIHPEKEMCPRRFLGPSYPSVDQPGGYKSCYVLQPASSVVLATPFVRSAMNKLSIRTCQAPDPTFSGVYVDQNDLVYTELAIGSSN